MILPPLVFLASTKSHISVTYTAWDHAQHGPQKQAQITSVKMFVTLDPEIIESFLSSISQRSNVQITCQNQIGPALDQRLSTKRPSYKTFFLSYGCK